MNQSINRQSNDEGKTVEIIWSSVATIITLGAVSWAIFQEAYPLAAILAWYGIIFGITPWFVPSQADIDRAREAARINRPVTKTAEAQIRQEIADLKQRVNRLEQARKE